MESREQRIATLATTLRSSGIAKSDSQAKMMAEDMIGVEEHVQRDYEVEHTRAHEYLQTAKNLGNPRQIIKPETNASESKTSESKIEVKQESSRTESSRPAISRTFEELYTSRTEPSLKREVKMESSENVEANFGGKTLNQAFDHDTHNSALEAIKKQVSHEQISREDTPEDNHDEFISVDELLSKPVKKETIETPIEETLEAPEKPKILESDIVKAVPVQNLIKENIADIPNKVQEESFEEPVQESKLDTQKLIDLMEEDGKLEEHTREIKEKPKDVKPKEAYEENNIDLGSMFDFNKGTMRK